MDGRNFPKPRRVSEERLKELHEIVRLQVRPRVSNNSRKEKPTKVMVYIDGQELSKILFELKERRRKAGGPQLGFNTKRFIEMKIGEVIEMPPMTQGTISNIRKTARNHLNDPKAQWHTRTMDNGNIRVERVPNGTRPVYGRQRNPAVSQLALMLIGETTILASVNKNKMYNGLKVQARIEMDYPRANWRCENLANGNLRVKRIS